VQQEFREQVEFRELLGLLDRVVLKEQVEFREQLDLQVYKVPLEPPVHKVDRVIRGHREQ
jgi:hypothetical protein